MNELDSRAFVEEVLQQTPIEQMNKRFRIYVGLIAIATIGISI